ncbi:cysteine-rich DPF motif domain-containing protein 1 isoform 3-T3 [Trichechus inunguis]
MASEAERRPQGVFECQLCALSAPYSYVGQKPPNTRSVVLLEESYVLKDPFTADRDKFLVLGSRCSVCSRLVCVGPSFTNFLFSAKMKLLQAACQAVYSLPPLFLHPGGPGLWEKLLPVPGYSAPFRPPSSSGMQFILHQEILPPLCLGEHRCFPTGNPARRGQEESSGQDALRQAQFSDLRAARGQVGSPCTELWGTAAARARLLLSWRPWCLASFLGCVYSRGS